MVANERPILAVAPLPAADRIDFFSSAFGKEPQYPGGVVSWLGESSTKRCLAGLGPVETSHLQIIM